MDRDEARVESRMNIAWIMLLLVGIPIALSVIPFGNGISERAPRTVALNNVKQILLGCRAYAADHGGAYPPSLEVLYPDYVDVEKMFHVIDEHGKILPTRILYNPGHIDTGETMAVLLEHPAIKGERIVGYVGGHVAAVESR